MAGVVCDCPLKDAAAWRAPLKNVKSKNASKTRQPGHTHDQKATTNIITQLVHLEYY
jgi:hypothetical protein